MTSSIFEQWIKDLDRSMTRQKRKISSPLSLTVSAVFFKSTSSVAVLDANLSNESPGFVYE
jgi:hypothetical protein